MCPPVEKKKEEEETPWWTPKQNKGRKSHPRKNDPRFLIV